MLGYDVGVVIASLSCLTAQDSFLEVKKMAKPKITYFVKKAVQDFAKANKMMVGSDAYDAINVRIDEMMKEAANRCKENKRKTMKAYDF